MSRTLLQLALAVFLALFALSHASAATVEAVEYSHAGFDHYFITAFPEEAAALDSGKIVGILAR